MTRSRKIYTLACKYCNSEFTSTNKPRPGLTQSCSKQECLRVSSEEHNAAVAAYRANRPARQPRSEKIYAATDWNMLVAFSQRKK